MVLDWREIDEAEERFETQRCFPGSDVAKLLTQKKLSQYNEYSRFWAPRIEMGRKCQRYHSRKIFTPEQREYYETTLNKIPVEPQELKPIISSLMFMVSRRINPGTVTMEDDNPPPTAARPEVVQTVLKWLQNKIKLEHKQKSALRDGLVTGYPQVLWFDMVTGEDGISTDLQATLLPWEASLPSPQFTDPYGTDIDDLIDCNMRTRRQMLDMFPERESALAKHEEMMRSELKGNGENGYKTLEMALNDLTSADRSDYLANQILLRQFDAINGNYFVIRHTFPVKYMRTVWYSEELDDAVEIPESWESWRVDAWKAAHPEYDRAVRREMKTLWSTIISGDGFVWYNGQHWYQNEGKLPAAMFVADMVDRQPTGVAEDLLPYIFSVAVCETEGLDQVRKGTGSVTFVEEGSLQNPESLGKELNSANGVVTLKNLKGGRTTKDVVTWRERKPNTTFLDFGDRHRQQMREVHHVKESVTGSFGGRQSFKAKQTEIDQSMAPQAPYVNSYEQFTFNTNSLLCSLFPYVLNEEIVVEIEDEFGQSDGPMKVNEEQYNAEGTQAQIVANDLTSVRYRYVSKPGNDSETSREDQMREFVEMLSAFGNTLLQLNPAFMANFLLNLPNRYARQAGKYMQEAAGAASQQQQAEKQQDRDADKMKQQTRTVIELMKILGPRLMMKTDSQDIAAAPEGFRLFYQMYLAQTQQAQQIAQQSMALNGTQVPQQPQPQLPQMEAAQQQEPAMMAGAGGSV